MARISAPVTPPVTRSATRKRAQLATATAQKAPAPAKRSRTKSAQPPAGAKPSAVAAAAGQKATTPAPPVVSEEVQKFQRAAAALRPGSVQGKLPCREQEQDDIRQHLHTAVRQGGSVQVLYISGMPGTGKTGSVLHILDHMERAKDVPSFKMVHINAMRLGSPNAVFSNIWSQLPKSSRAKVNASAAPGELANLFENRQAKDPVVVLLIDEIDHLVTRSQTVLYRVFDWLQCPRPRLVVVAISNTMDLPERLLPRVASRFGIVRVEFQPYNRGQIIEIISQRLAAVSAKEVLSPVALKLSAARVAAGSGDIRKALQCLRRAIEVRLSTIGATGPADIKHLEVAEKELLRASPAARAVAGLSLGARRLLTSMLLQLRKTKSDAVAVPEVIARYAKLAVATAESTDTLLPVEVAPGGRFAEEVQSLVHRLEAMSLVIQQVNGASRTLTLGAGLDAEDLAAALEPAENDEGIRSLIRDDGPRVR